MARIQQAVEVAPLPAKEKVQPSIESVCDRTKHLHSHGADPAALDPQNGPAGRTRKGRKVVLAPAAADPECPDRGTDPSIIHRRIIQTEAYLPVTGTGGDPV